MLSMALPYCRDILKLSRVLITCDDNNIASAKVIEKNGGTFWKTRLSTI
ncbi:MAG: GNAT family N-acetyltransferase [Eubacteriales bacterium]